MTASKIEEIFKDEEIRKKLYLIIHLRQEERILSEQQEQMKWKCKHLQNQIEDKLKLNWLGLFNLIATLEKDEYLEVRNRLKQNKYPFDEAVFK